MGLCTANADSRAVSPMAQSVPPLGFGILRDHEVVSDFDGGDISSDAGVLLPSEAERRPGLIAAPAG